MEEASLIDGFLFFFLPPAILPDSATPHSNSKSEKKLSVFRDLFLKSSITPLNLFISWLYYPFHKKVAYVKFFY